MVLRLRARLIAALGNLGVPAMRLRVARLSKPRFLTVLNYHRVDAVSAAADTDDGVLDATPESLNHALELVHRYMTPVALPDLLDYLEGLPLPRNPVLVTFDDGYRDNLENALPILRRHGIRATFFIPTAYVGGRRLYWWDRLSWILTHARQRSFCIDFPARLQVDLDADAKGAIRALSRVIKTCHGLDVETFLTAVASAACAPWTAQVEARLVSRLVMDWSDVRELLRSGMDVGSHTRTHRVLQTVPAEQLDDELAGSRRELERELGIRVEAIAYPVGAPIASHPAILDAVQRAGYRLGFSYGTGRQSLRRFDRLDVRRFAGERTDSDAEFLGRLALPWLAP